MVFWLRPPHVTTPRNKDRFLGTPANRGANNYCAYGAGYGRLSALQIEMARLNALASFWLVEWLALPGNG